MVCSCLRIRQRTRYSIFLLEQKVACISDVSEDLPDRGVAEVLSFIGFHAHLGKLLFRGFRRQAIQVIVVDEPNDLCFLLVVNQMIALPAVAVDLKSAVGDTLVIR